MCRHRPVLTVQLHQIPPISKRRQGLYKHCPPRHGHHAIRIHILPLSPRWFSESHTAKNTYLRVVCGWLSESRVGDVIGEKQIWEKFNHRAASPILLPVTSSPKLWRLESLDADGPADELNPRTSLLPQQPKLSSLRQPHMNNRSAQVGRLLFHIDENCSGWERGGGGTWNHGRLPLSGPGAKTFPSLLSPTLWIPLSHRSLRGPAQPMMKGFLSCFWLFTKPAASSRLSHTYSICVRASDATWQG